MPGQVRNLFTVTGTEEETATLLQGGSFRLEQITSYGQASARDFWYDQAEPEWVLLARGTATLEFDKGIFIQLWAGDYLLIPAHEKHRVEATSSDAVWLALYFRIHSSQNRGGRKKPAQATSPEEVTRTGISPP